MPVPSWRPLTKESLEEARKEMAEDARRREASQPPEDPTQGSSHPTYESISAQVGDLDLQGQLRLLEELAAWVRQKLGEPPRHTILEMQGLGKGIWEGIDAQGYVDHERNAWNG